MHISRRRIGGLLAAMAVLVTPLAAVSVITAAPASAHVPDNSDPMTTGCWDSNAYIVKQGTDGYGNTLRLWYSPDCGTNWAQIDSGGTWLTDIYTQTQDGRETSLYAIGHYKGWAWSNQLYAPTTKADACEIEYNPNVNRWFPPNCIGQY